MKKFKILSIDGGGSKGIIPVGMLEEFQENVDKRIYEYFDLIAGTSIGSIIAAGIAFDMPIKDIANLFYTRLSHVFERRLLDPQGLIKSRYYNQNLKEELVRLFGDRKMKDAKTILIINGTDITNMQPIEFSSRRKYCEMLVSEVTYSSCLVPTFFDPNLVDNRLVADGGLWANNPTLAAITNCIYFLKKSLEEIYCLSLGTGHSTAGFKPSDVHKDWGVLQWLTQFDKVAIDPASYAMHMLTGKLLQDRYIRLNVHSNLDITEKKTERIKKEEYVGRHAFSEKKLEILDMFVR
ncbi:MAG: patatin-like phospholipase family protein [Fusobacteria bacterium]|nr:patatin-like phospholipase family protein [Fusobacteriota bacterium]